MEYLRPYRTGPDAVSLFAAFPLISTNRTIAFERARERLVAAGDCGKRCAGA
jgi:hypothetical protein